ncbi:MAG: septal ring lytic transglycosylase RlpA family protein [Pseudomonadota bacterium]
MIFAAACSNTSESEKVSVKRPVQAVVETLSHNEAKNTGNAGQYVAATPTISDKTKFASRDFGVAGSPRVTKSKRVKKGGGTYKVGKPYTIRGKRYVPREDPDYNKVGLASWYGPNFHGRLTANGEIYDQYGLSAAHPTLPLPSYAKVTNLENGASVTVRVNDRGPYSKNRIIDLSSRAAQLLGYTRKGVAKVKVEYVGKARLDGLDESYLVASYDPGTLNPNTIPPNPGGEILLAQNTTQPVRSTLQAYRQAGFTAPLPEFRPVTADGFPVDISALNTPRPNGLVRGFAAEASGSAASMAILKRIAELPKVAAPDQGMAQTVRVTLGPFANYSKLSTAEEIMLRWGPATIQHVAGKGGHVHATILESDFTNIVSVLGENDISGLKRVR